MTMTATQNAQYAALLAHYGDEDLARVAFDRIHPPTIDPQVQALVDSGEFTQDEALVALGLAPAPAATPPAPAPAAPAPAPVKPDFDAKTFAETKGFTTTRGRIYGGVTLAESIVRVHRTGTPEIVTSSGKGRTDAVLVFRTDTGDVAMQNLVKATA